MFISKVSINRALLLAGVSTLFASFQLITMNNYIVIFLEEDLLTSIELITVIVSLRNLLQLIFRVPLGELSQILGRKPLIIFGHFCYTIALFLLFIAGNWIYVLFAVFFISLGMSSFWSSLFAYIADITLDDFGISSGRIFQLSDIGTIFGSLLAVFVLKELLLGLRELFFIVSTVGIITGFFSLLFLPDPLKLEDRKKVKSISRALITSFTSMVYSLRNITNNNGLKMVYSYQFLLSFADFMTVTFIPLLIISKGFSKSDVSEIVFIAIFCVIWIKGFLGRLTDRLNFKKSITGSLLSVSFVILLFNLANEFYLLIFLYILLNAIMITAYITTQRETTQLAPEEYRGVSLGALGFYVSLGRGVSTLVLGPIWKILGLEIVFISSAFFIALITLMLSYFAKTKL